MSEKYVKSRTYSHEITKGIQRQTSIFGDTCIVFSVIYSFTPKFLCNLYSFLYFLICFSSSGRAAKTYIYAVVYCFLGALNNDVHSLAERIIITCLSE